MTLRGPQRLVRSTAFALGLVAASSCNAPEELGPSTTPPDARQPFFDFALSSYFPPSEVNGGWRKKTAAGDISALGMNPGGLNDLGSYSMSLPWENYTTGVSGFDPSNKAALVIKNGWLVGEYYNKSSARTGMYYLASNGKSFAMMLVGRMQLDYPGLNLNLGSKLYDRRWLSDGFPLTDARKADITFNHVFGQVSGIMPEEQGAIAGGSVKYEPGWNFAPFTVGKDPDFPVTARLYFDPGDPSTYGKDPYSSISFNHFSLVFRSVTGLEPGAYLRKGILDPIGVGRMAYMLSPGMGNYVWAAGGNNLTSARDYVRLGYLLLHEGNWAGKRLFTSSWIRQFTTRAGYPNMNSNADCRWGAQYPKDIYRIIGSGVNMAWIVPSLDLVATLTGRVPNTLRDQVSRTFLQKLFASVTQQYVTCDGRVVNGSPFQASSEVTALLLINANTDQPIVTMTNGMTITLANLPTRNLNIRAVTSPSVTGSVRFALDANSNYRTETIAPYSLAGDVNGDYNAWTPSIGTHTIKATPYTGGNASGTAGPALTINFTVK